MYDSLKLCLRYSGFKSPIIDILNGDSSTDIDEISDKIYEAYCDGDLTSSQYVDLVRLIQDY